MRKTVNLGAWAAMALVVGLVIMGADGTLAGVEPETRTQANAHGVPLLEQEGPGLRSSGTDCDHEQAGYDARIADASLMQSLYGSTQESGEPLGVATNQLIPPFESCTGLRPGARMTSPSGCSFNFVFSQGSDLFIGTAAHCVDNPGQRVSAAGVSDFGSVVFNGWQGAPSQVVNDFALIRIDPDRHGVVDPTLCTWGGPTGVGSPGGVASQDFLLQYGWGVASQFTPHTRSRIHDEFLSSTSQLSWNGVGSGGDSGSPLLYGDGRAAGIHTAGITPVAGVVLETGPTIERILTLTSDAGFNLQLETASKQWTMPI